MKNQEKALAALLSSDTQAEAAAKIGVTARTLRSYLADPAFFAEYQRMRRQVVSDATRQIQSSLHSAIQALLNIVEDENTSAPARISAARSILEYGLRFTEVTDVLTRLEDLERAMK